MVIFRADESACGDGELAGTSVSTPRGSRASSLWPTANVGAVTKVAARKQRHIIFIKRSWRLGRESRMHPGPPQMFAPFRISHKSFGRQPSI
jgi:hypothetical protein